MAEMTRAARAQLVADAAALQEQASALLAARQAARAAGNKARRRIAERPIPLLLPAAHDVTTGEADGSSTDANGTVQGRVLPLLPSDADLFHAELTLQQLGAVPPSFDFWLQNVAAHFPVEIPLASPQGLFSRFLGRGPDPATRDQATSNLKTLLDVASTPQAQHDLARSWPVDTTGSPLPHEQLRRAAAAALGTADDAIAVVPTREVREVARAVLNSAEASRAGSELEKNARSAAEDVVDGSTQALLANIDMEHFRTRVSVGRFPSKALERAGIRSVADVTGWTPDRLTALDGIGPDTAHALVIAARQMRKQARGQAKIDLTGESIKPVRLRMALKALLDHRLRERGATADRHLAARMEEFARRAVEETQHDTPTAPYAPGDGHAPRSSSRRTVRKSKPFGTPCARS